MQLVRGYVFFENKKNREVIENLKSFKLNQSDLYFFKQIFINNKIEATPGVLIDGKVNKEYSSYDVVKTFRKIMKLKVEFINCDVSLESEDIMLEIKNGDIKGFYYSIKTEKFGNKKNAKLLALALNKKYDTKNLFIRSINNKKEGSWSLDFIVENKLKPGQVEDFMSSEGVKNFSLSYFYIE